MHLHHFLQSVYGATWLWLPLLVLFLVQGLHCSLSAKLMLFKIALYYIVSAISLQLLLPSSHLALRTMLFDLTTRVFLFIQAAEMLWSTWNAGSALTVNRTRKQQKQLKDEDDDEDNKTLSGTHRQQWLSPYHTTLMLYMVSTLLYLGWTILGIMFAFTLTPGM